MNLQPQTKSATTTTEMPATERRRFAWLRVRRNQIILAILLIAAVAWWQFGGETESTTRPLVVSIEVGDIENAVTAAGTLQPKELVEVGAQVSGQLQKLHVDVGDVVASGQLVAEIDATVQLNRVAASRASLAGLEALLSARRSALQLAEANAARQTRLMEDDASTQADFDSAMNALASAQSSLTELLSRIEQSRAGLASDEAQLGFTKIYAPIDGTVVAIDRKEGVTLNANQATPVIMRIADLSTMTVEAQVSEADVTKLRSGMEVYFTTLGSGERSWSGVLRQILPTPIVTNNVVLYTALFDVDNSDQALLSNMTAQVFFITSSARNVVKVPVGALTYPDGGGRPSGAAGTFAMGGGMGRAAGGVRDPERDVAGRAGAGMGVRPGRGDVASVQVVLEDGSIETREVRVGVTSRIAAEVLSGLEAGDRVVAGVVQSRTADNSRPTQQTAGPR